MSNYICENKSLCVEEFFDDINDLYDYMYEHIKDKLIFIELCREHTTEFNIDEYDKQLKL